MGALKVVLAVWLGAKPGSDCKGARGQGGTLQILLLHP